MRKFIIILAIGFGCPAGIVNAQLVTEILNYDYRIALESGLADLDYKGHTAFKPLLFSDVNTTYDSERKFKLHYTNFEDGKKFKISAIPLLGSSYVQDLSYDSSYFSYGGGARLDMRYSEKWNGSLDFYYENGSYPRYVGGLIAADSVFPAMGKASPNASGYSFSRVSGFVSYTPNHFFEIKAGVGKNFIGDGYRSLLLSDNAYQYPYLRLNTTFWRLRYTNLFCMMDDISTDVGFAEHPVKKFATIHFLDWNISKRMNIGIFESVIWQSKDTLYNRGFDIHYLNPIIFYRTVEYSLGSSDNSLLGLNAKLKINSHYQLYLQFILDEFLLSEVLAGRGWWANKYGVQFGVKAIEPFNVKNLFVQSEFNVVRPFTYSHGSVIQNYGHLAQPLAHPIGSNFYESVSIIRYQWKNFQFTNQMNFALYGTDSTSALSYGGDIYQSYRNRAMEYYNRIGQGISNHLWFNRASVAWLIDPAINLRFEIAHTFRQVTTQFGTQAENFISFGIKTNLWNSYTDY